MTPATSRGAVDIPAPVPQPFVGGIRHPELWLWDSWVVRVDRALHLYCLALARRTCEGRPIGLREFNDYPFHYRRFDSTDDGRSWRDRGAVMRPGNVADGSDARNVWSGGVHHLGGERILFGYTGISANGPAHHFVQSAIFAQGTVDGPVAFPERAQSHPIRDRDAILAAGYYVSEREGLGSDFGEGEGPLLAWRDPFIFEAPGGGLRAVWSGKLTDRVPAVVHARLHRAGAQWRTELLPPIRLPDATAFTQAEVPKICRDRDTGEWLLMVSACDRLQESQPDSEVVKELRLYRSGALAGPWRPAFSHGSVIPDTGHYFGACFLDAEVSGGRARVLSPYWAAAPDGLPMSIAPVFDVPTA